MHCRLYVIELLFLFIVPVLCKNRYSVFNISVVHINDFHARFEETAADSSACRGTNCIGGFSRMYATIMKYKEQNPETIILNAGDNFQGTLWYNIYKWNVTQHFLNKIPFDAITLGNHEFDDKISGVVPYIKSLKAPVVVANIDDKYEPLFQGTCKKSVVIERNGKKIGIIGVMVKETTFLSNTEQLEFLDESTSVNAEAERLVREEGVFTNIVLSHSGYDIEKILASKATGKISLIVGGHSHSLLYTGDVPSPDVPSGPYPTVIKRPDGKDVLVVQASAFTKYLGNITISYDDEGDVVGWEGKPIYLDSSLPQDSVINEELRPWKDGVEKQGNRIIGHSLVLLNQHNRRTSECLLGNFVTDAMVFSQTHRQKNNDSWAYAAVAITNAGGLRANIPRGDITYADLVAAQPFGNTLDIGELQGKHIWQMLEKSAEPHYQKKDLKALNLIHLSGIKTVFDVTKPPGQRVKSVKIRCSDCRIPKYEPLDFNKMYRIILPSFLTKGGNQFFVIRDNLRNLEQGEIDLDAFLRYLKTNSPLMQEIEGRIHIIKNKN